jgi:hypothetical protein
VIGGLGFLIFSQDKAGTDDELLPKKDTSSSRDVQDSSKPEELQTEARDINLTADAAKLKTDLELYNIDFGQYPESLGEIYSSPNVGVPYELHEPERIKYERSAGGQGYTLTVTLHNGGTIVIVDGMEQ